MKRRSCELCKHTARIYCESDKASLCYDCDQNVHSANFLVAKHSRTLLCHKCQSPTPWVASGLNLGRAASLCLYCIHQNSSQRCLPEDDQISHRKNDVVAEEICSVYDDLDDDDDVCETDGDDEEYSQTDDNADEEDEKEDGENQVVPWSSLASTPTAASSSNNVDFCSSRFSSEYFSSPMKPKREGANLDYEDDTGSSSERFNGEAGTETDDDASLKSFRTSKVIRSKRVRY